MKPGFDATLPQKTGEINGEGDFFGSLGITQKHTSKHTLSPDTHAVFTGYYGVVQVMS